MYVFDTNSLIKIFDIPKKVFTSMWDEYDGMIKKGSIVSVQEVAKEIADCLQNGQKITKSCFRSLQLKKPYFFWKYLR